MNRFEEKTENTDRSLPLARRFPIKEAMGYVINAFLIIILTLALYAKIDSSFDVNWGEIGFELVLIYMVSAIVYTNSLSLGKTNGQKRKEYQDAYKKCVDAITKLAENKYIEKIDEFCIERQRVDLEARKKIVLSSVHIPYEKYEAEYADKSIKELRHLKKPLADNDNKPEEEKKTDEEKNERPMFNKVQLRALIKVMYMKPHKLSSQSLTKPINAKTDEFIEDCTKIERKMIARKLIISFVTTFVVVNFSIELVNAFSFKTVIESVVRLIPILWSWVSGQFAGYNISINNKVANFTDKARFCQQADNWLNEKYGKEVESMN